jgi:S1-C subfamily serine protease
MPAATRAISSRDRGLVRGSALARETPAFPSPETGSHRSIDSLAGGAASGCVLRVGPLVLTRPTLLVSVFATGVLCGLAALPSEPAAASAPSGEPVEVELTGDGWPFSSAKSRTKTLDPAVAPAVSAAPATSGREIARRALEYTVYIRGGPVYGAGVVLDRQGHVLTCDHVIDGLKSIDVYVHGQSKPAPARVIGRDKALDLALLAVDFEPRASATVASIADVEMGDEVYAMGAPRKMSFSLGRGVVSYVGRSFDGTLYVQTDLAANPGSSGGPVLNERGELIGVSSFVLRGGQGLSFAVPVDYAYTRFGDVLGKARDGARFSRWLAARGSATPATTADAPTRATGKR